MQIALERKTLLNEFLQDKAARVRVNKAGVNLTFRFIRVFTVHALRWISSNSPFKVQINVLFAKEY